MYFPTLSPPSNYPVWWVNKVNRPGTREENRGRIWQSLAQSKMWMFAILGLLLPGSPAVKATERDPRPLWDNGELQWSSSSSYIDQPFWRIGPSRRCKMSASSISSAGEARMANPPSPRSRLNVVCVDSFFGAGYSLGYRDSDWPFCDHFPAKKNFLPRINF